MPPRGNCALFLPTIHKYCVQQTSFPWDAQQYIRKSTNAMNGNSLHFFSLCSIFFFFFSRTQKTTRQAVGVDFPLTGLVESLVPKGGTGKGKERRGKGRGKAAHRRWRPIIVILLLPVVHKYKSIILIKVSALISRINVSYNEYHTDHCRCTRSTTCTTVVVRGIGAFAFVC